MPITAIRGVTLIDGTGSDPIRNATIVVEGGRIADVRPDASGGVSDDATVIDGQGRSAIPGLIDCHVHVMTNGINLLRLLSTPPSLGLLQCIPNLGATLQAGFTTVRDAGGAPLGVKMAVEQGIIPGPRMLVSISVLSQTGGHGDHRLRSGVSMDLFPDTGDIPHAVVDGVDEMRHKVREILRAGADWIKLCTTGGVLSPTDLPSSSQFTVEEISVAVEEAGASGDTWCMAHAQGTQGIKNALLAGVKSIEHGIWLDDETIGMMKERDAWLVPTLVAPVQVLRRAEQDPTSMPPWGVEKSKRVIKDHTESFRRAVEAGVNIAMGTDSGVGPHGENAEELTLMAQNGMSPMDALLATTSRGAELLRLQDQIGTIEPGKLADVILADGNPLDDISILQDQERITLVMKDGQVYRDTAKQPALT